MSARDTLVSELTQLILEATEKGPPSPPLSSQEPIFGSGTRLALDSLDALQVSMALQKRYGVRLTDSKETRRVLACIGSLADYLLQKRA